VEYYSPEDERRPSRRLWIVLGVAVALFIAVGFGSLLWLVFRGNEAPEPEPLKVTKPSQPSQPTKLPRMANLPPQEPSPKPIPPSYTPTAPLLEQVREAMRNGIDPDAAVTLAKSLPDEPERADAAFILWEYAAEEGNAEAALIVGRYFDPTDTGDSGTIIKDPAVAYEWYQAALAGGQPPAKNHLSHLKKWVQEQADQGSGEARALLKDWL
jgi:cytoskeletal protein RodZ